MCIRDRTHPDQQTSDDEEISHQGLSQSEASTSTTPKNTIPVRKHRAKNPPELEEASARMNTAFATLNDVLKMKKLKKVKTIVIYTASLLQKN